MCSFMYVELHCHSAYSFLDGASQPEELVAAAVKLGYEALALTDHNSLCGSMEFAVAAEGLGLRAIHGAEIDLDDGRHLTLLVADVRGWSNLCRLLTRAHQRTRARPGPPAQPQVALEDVLVHAEGLVCLSGCALRGVRDLPTLTRLREAFGPERLRIELQRPFLEGDRARNRALEALARRLGVPCVATGDVHAHARARAPLQDALVAIRLHSTLDASEPQRRGNFSHVLASPQEMERRLAEHPAALAETVALAQRLRFDLRADLGYRYPGSDDERAMAKLAELSCARLEDRYRDAPASVRERARARLEQELSIIDRLGLAGFFLLHHDLLELAREVAVEVRGPDSARALLPPGRGRGSSVSSIVCYLTGLSHVDPIANELLIGRFLNEELTALPDIDLDFPRDIREVLIPRVHERYGRERSALVAAFPTYRARGAIRELGKVLGLPAGELERVARSSEGWDARDVARDIEVALGRRGASGRWAWLARLAAQAHGLPRHLSQHSGGMIVSTRPLIDCCPIVPAAMEGRQIVQWDKDSCADAGFLKIDLLGLGMLSAVERCVELIARTRRERIDLSRIPYDDPATYQCIQAADTTGVFQIESRAQMQSLRRTRPESLQDLTIQVAIVRPGPIQGGAVNPYIERRQRLREDPSFQVPYLHPSLEPVLSATLGAIIFQDQVLEVAIAFAGFSVGEAEGLRRAMSRKRSRVAIEAYRERFVAGARRLHGVDRATAERVFGMIQGFSGFGFPKAHGAAFGLLAYQSAWLRVHYPEEFLCALLNEQPMGFYPPDALVHEAQRRGIEVCPPDVNESGLECELERVGDGGAGGGGGGNTDGAAAGGGGAAAGGGGAEATGGGAEATGRWRVRIGLGYVRGVREHEVRALLEARAAGGRFASLSDLASRAGAASASLEMLAWAGACDALAAESAPSAGPATGASAGPATGASAGRQAVSPRRLVLWQLGIASPGRRVPGGVQLTLALDLPAPPRLRAPSSWEAMLADYGTIGLTTRTHPLELLRERLGPGVLTSATLAECDHGTRVRTGGMVVARQRPGTARGVVFILLEDEFGTINLIVPPRVYERHRLLARGEPLLLADGRLERYARSGGAINVLVERLEAIPAPDRVLAEVKDFSLLDERALRAAGAPRAAGASASPAGGGGAVNGSGRDVDSFRAVAPPVLSFASGRRR
jgi:error-prone DNA polymerase